MDDLRGYQTQMREVHAYWTAIGRRCRAGMLLLLSFDVLLLLVWAGWVGGAPEVSSRPAAGGAAAWLGAAAAAAAGLLRSGGGGACVALCWVVTGAAWRSEAYQWRVHTAGAFVRRANAVLRRFHLSYSEEAAALCRPDGSRALPPNPMPTSASAGGGGGGMCGTGGMGGMGGGMAGGRGDDASCASAAASSSSWYAGAGGVDHSDGGGTSGAQSRGEGFGGVLLNALGGGNIGHGRGGSGCAGGSAGGSVPPGRATERRLPPRMRSRTPMRRAPGGSGRVQKTIVD
jgi:hypothetical protein